MKGLMSNNERAARNIVAQFVEEVNADSIIVIWSEVGKDTTSSKVVTFGNQFAVKAMVKAMHDDYLLEEMNERKDKKRKE